MWKLRCGLGPAEVPPRVLEDFVRDYGLGADAGQPIGKTYITCVRDAFAEIVLDMNRQHVSALCANADAVVLSHIHDEASMRVRSVSEGTEHVHARGMSTKVQNNVLRASIISGESVQHVTFLLELQPLENKSANTLAHALRLATDAFLEAAVAHRQDKPALSVTHAITGVQPLNLRFSQLPEAQRVTLSPQNAGDGIATNHAAMRRLLRYYNEHSTVSGKPIKYRQLGYPCAAHQVNLV
eukprot:2859480-Amphidinium_carterae.1